MAETDLRGEQTSEQAGHELSDLRPGYIGLFGIGLAAVIALVVGASSLLYHMAGVRQAKREIPLPRLAREREPAPQPRLQVDAQKDMRQMRAGEDAALNSYGWVDREAGIVRIPVERAMEILAAKGLPARKQEEKTR